MKIRGLLAGLSLALALAACGAPTLPASPAADAVRSENQAPPPPDSAADRSGGAMGSGA